MIIYLPKMRLWASADATTYPRCLARGDTNRVYTKSEILELFGVSHSLSQKRKDALRDVHRNIWDIEPADGGVTIRGVSLLEREDEGYRMTSRAVEMVEAYRQDSQGTAWQTLLVRMLIDYDLRLRIVLYLLGSRSYILSTRGKYELADPDSGESFILFRQDEPNINSALNRWCGHLLGKALVDRIDRLGMEQKPVTRIAGQRGGQPALNPRSLTQEIRLLSNMGVLERKGRWEVALSDARAKSVFPPDSYSELIGSSIAEDFIEALRNDYMTLKDSEGYVVYQRLKSSIERKAAWRNFDTRFQCSVEEGKVLILRHSKGLRSDGSGYLDNSDFQRLQLAFDY